MLIPKPIKKGFDGTIHLVGIVLSLFYSIIVNMTNLVKEQVFSYLGIEKPTKKTTPNKATSKANKDVSDSKPKPTRHKSSKKQSDKVINLHDKANKKES
jgi:hypothetical protein